MSNAYRDENDVPTLIAASSADGKTPVRLYADPTTHRLLVDNAGVTSGTSVPSTTPTSLGQVYINTSSSKVYVSTGTSSSADWTILN